MAENLKVTHYNDSTEISTGYNDNDWLNLSSGAYAVYDDDPSNAEVYGNLYNWYAVDDDRGICPNSYPKCDPAEQYPHAAQWATEDEVYFQYQMPNWEFNEIGDLLGADFMNRVYIGYAVVDDIASIPEYDAGESGCYADAGDVTGDGILNVLVRLHHMINLSVSSE